MLDSAAAADTIFALSSGAPPAAIAIIRVSGPRAFDAVRALAGRVPHMRKASLAKLYDPASGGLIDEALLLTFPAGQSVTGEDLAELHVHGGRAVIRSVEAALSNIEGLRMAEPGEFTRRAFLNDRIGLNEAEGLSDLLAAETEIQRRSAAAMHGGAFTRAIEGWRTELLRISAQAEAELDFSDEDDVESQDSSIISDACEGIRKEISGLLAAPTAEKLRDGLRIVLAGPPNSGKSTLLNALVDREAAIVSDIAGTTRDVIEIPLALDGLPFLITDTAGLRDDSVDAIEGIGIERALNAVAQADMVLWLGDEGAGPSHPNLIEVDAKADLASRQRKSAKAHWVSAKTGAGLSILVGDILSRAKTLLPPPDGFAVNARQRKLLQEAGDALDGISQTRDWLIVGEQLRLARRAFDSLTGRSHTEDLLDTLFGKFCIGK